MKTWIVIFSSHAEPPADATFAKVIAKSPLAAMAKARSESELQHPWTFAWAYPWPRGCRDEAEAATKVAASLAR